MTFQWHGEYVNIFLVSIWHMIVCTSPQWHLQQQCQPHQHSPCEVSTTRLDWFNVVICYKSIIISCFDFILISQDLTSYLEEMMVKHPLWLKRFETFFCCKFHSDLIIVLHIWGSRRRIWGWLADGDLPCHGGMERGEGEVWTLKMKGTE